MCIFVPKINSMGQFGQDILLGAERAFLDRTVLSQARFTPQFVTNSGEDKVITLLDEELKDCDAFLMSSNAITLDGELVNIDGAGSRLSYLL